MRKDSNKVLNTSINEPAQYENCIKYEPHKDIIEISDMIVEFLSPEAASLMNTIPCPNTVLEIKEEGKLKGYFAAFMQVYVEKTIPMLLVQNDMIITQRDLRMFAELINYHVKKGNVFHSCSMIRPFVMELPSSGSRKKVMMGFYAFTNKGLSILNKQQLGFVSEDGKEMESLALIHKRMKREDVIKFTFDEFRNFIDCTNFQNALHGTDGIFNINIKMKQDGESYEYVCLKQSFSNNKDLAGFSLNHYHFNLTKKQKHEESIFHDKEDVSVEISRDKFVRAEMLGNSNRMSIETTEWEALLHWRTKSTK